MKARIPKHREFIIEIDENYEKADECWAKLQEIMDDYTASMMGKTLEVLVDGFDQEAEQFYGRTFADSPEIDGRVWIASQEALVEGTFVKVCIDGLVEGELSGYLVEEE